MISLSPENGWISIDEFGIIRPWYVSGILEIIDKMDFVGKRVFEYGAGNSTLWYRSRGAKVEGVDSSPTWSNLALVLHETDREAYIKSIYKYPKFDLVAIDGDFRDDCLAPALDCLNPKGIVVIDNFLQPSVPMEWFRTLDILAARRLVYEQHFQALHPDWCSLIIYT